jgi:hypothetical protein
MNATATAARHADELLAENMSLYLLLASVREAAGDPHGRLMQDELVARIAVLAEGVEPVSGPPTASPLAERFRESLLNLSRRIETQVRTREPAVLTLNDATLLLSVSALIAEASSRLRSAREPKAIEVSEVPLDDARICVKCHHCQRGIDRLACGLTDDVACADERQNADGCGPSGIHFLAKA